MANPVELYANLCTLSFVAAFNGHNPGIEKSAIYAAERFGSAIALARNREVVKAFGGVLNGLDGNFGPVQRGQKMNARTNQFWRFPF